MLTVEIYKTDKRTKAGERQVSKQDYDTDNLSMLEHTVKHTWRAADGYRYEIHMESARRAASLVLVRSA
mgnify:FL=1